MPRRGRKILQVFLGSASLDEKKSGEDGGDGGNIDSGRGIA
jgi:hypothetical protein